MALERPTTGPVHRQPVDVHPANVVRPHRMSRAPAPEADIALMPTGELHRDLAPARATPTPEALPRIPREAEQIRIIDRDDLHTIYEIEHRVHKNVLGYMLLNADVDRYGTVMLSHVEVCADGKRGWRVDYTPLRTDEIKKLYWSVIEAESYYRDHPVEMGGRK